MAHSYSSLDKFSGLLVKLQQLCLRWDRERYEVRESIELGDEFKTENCKS